MDATTVGVDLAKNIFVACVADCAGRIVERREFNRAGFLTWLGTLPAGTVIGMEACGSAHHWGRTAQRLGLASWATDLNPEAVLLNKAVVEVPPRFDWPAPAGPPAAISRELIQPVRLARCGAAPRTESSRRSSS